jgi:ParB-like chromosome segregation protein Spo0J
MTKGTAFQLREIKPRGVSATDAEMLSSTVDTGVSTSKAVVLEIELERIRPDFGQPRRILPSDLHQRLRQRETACREAIEELLRRRKTDDGARLILEGSEEASGLLDLAESIGEVGLRQAINVYEITDLKHPTGVGYRIGEGERRYWAHWILVLGGREDYKTIRCVVEKGLPDDLEVRIRQLAENAARQDLPAMARARLILGLKTHLAREAGIEVIPDAGLQELGDAITKARYRGLATRVAGVPKADEIAGVPDSHELDDMVGQTLRRFAGKAVSGQTVRNYLALLRLPPRAQELADAANLSEFRLRPVVGLDDPDHQVGTVERIVEENLSGRQVDALVKQAKAAAEGRKRMVAEPRAKWLTPRGLRRRVLSMVTYLEKEIGEMGGTSSFSAELRGVEEYREALEEMVTLRDLLNRILGQTELAGHTRADDKGPGE